MKKLFDIALGIVTSIGGFLEIGSIVTSAAAGAEYGTNLLWAVLLGGICLIFLVEMSGRFTAITKQTVVAAMRARFGFNFCVVPLLAILFVTLAVLATELAGVAAALELATGVHFRWWAPVVAFAVWLALWTLRFNALEYLVSGLGLVAVLFAVAAFRLAPSLHDVLVGLVPHRPPHDPKRWAFLVAVILGASISPVLFFFYSAGALEDKWTEKHLTINRIIAVFGMLFGTVLSLAVVVCAAGVLRPKGIEANDFHVLPKLLEEPFGKWGARGFVAALGICCFGAACEAALVVAYILAQLLGWNFGQNEKRKKTGRFVTAYSAAIVLSSLVVLAGVDPLKMTIGSMALTALTLPFAVFPFLILLNDERNLGKRRNRMPSNLVVGGIVTLALVLSVVTIPLQIAAGD